MNKNEAIAAAVHHNQEIKNSEYMLRRAVADAVLAGASWAEMGKALGLSKQTAYNRFNKYVELEKDQREWEAANPEEAEAARKRGEESARKTMEEIEANVEAKRASKNLDAPAPAPAAEPANGRIECTHCDWSIVFPRDEEEDAYMDFDDHMNTTHGDPDHSEVMESWTDPRPEFVLKSAGRIDGVAQPGTGKGPHTCPRCGSNNHKGKEDTIRAYFDCQPTKYDPQDIAHHLTTTGLSK